MIYVNVEFEGDSVDYSKITKVRLEYPDEKDFMSGLLGATIVPWNNQLTFEKGVYDNKKGFSPNSLQITGKNQSTGNKIFLDLPLPICMIKGKFTDAKETQG